MCASLTRLLTSLLFRRIVFGQHLTSTVPPWLLQAPFGLNEQRIERLDDPLFEVEGEVFPLFIESLEKERELTKA